MVIAAILINQSGKPAGSPSTSREDLDLNSLVTLTNNDNFGITSWLWEFISKPPTSSATISGSTTNTATFTPDVVGSYLIKLTVSDGASNVIDERVAAIKTSKFDVRVPAAKETDEFDGTAGWANAIYYAFTGLDANANRAGDPTKLDEQVSAPTYGDGYGWLYSAEIDGYTELFYRDSYGNPVQMSDKGVVYGSGSGGASQLSDLTDVSLSTPTAGNILIPNGSNWYSRTISGAISFDASGNTSFASTAETTVDDNDLVLIYDNTATAYRRMTRANFISGASNTLDQAYDEGGAGVGRTITADNGAVKIIIPNGVSDAGLHIENNDAGGNFSLYFDGTGDSSIAADKFLACGSTASGIDNSTSLFGAQQLGTGTASTYIYALGTASIGSVYVGHPNILSDVIIGNYSGTGTTSQTTITIGSGNANPTSIGIIASSYATTYGSVTIQAGSNGSVSLTGSNVTSLAYDELKLQYHETTGSFYIQDGTDNMVVFSTDGEMTFTPRPNQDFNVTTTLTGIINLDGYLTFDCGYREEAGWTQTYMEFSSSEADWTNFKSNFGEVSLFNALNQLSSGGGVSDKIEEGDSSVEVVDPGSDGYAIINVDGLEAARFDGYGLSTVEELKIKTYSQASEPTLGEDNRMAIWIDTDDSNRSFLLLRVGGSTRSVELT